MSAVLVLVLGVGSCNDAPPPASTERSGGTSFADWQALPPAERIDPQLVKELFVSLASGGPSAEMQVRLAGVARGSRADPNWPTLTYLVGEAERRRGDAERARATFRALASWAASAPPAGPYGDTWGGSGLAAIGLWRWLQMLEPHASEGSAEVKAEVDQALRIAPALGDTRLPSGMVRSGLLPALPLLQEDVARRLAHVAWKGKRAEAPALFLDFLAIDSGGKLDEIDDEILDQVKSRLSLERLTLFRARRQLQLVKTEAQKDRAARALETLWADDKVPADVRAEAGYEWANFNRRASQVRSRLIEVLTSTFKLAGENGAIAEQSLHLRGRVYNLDPGRSVDKFRADMNEQVRLFPQGRLADDALFQLATDYLFEPDVNSALSHFERLRNFSGPNDYRDSAYFLAALALIGQRGAADLDGADRLLEEYTQRYPDGVFRLRCLFWRGRIAEQKNEGERARALFRQVVDEAPYDYYGLRARMHLEDGPGAIGKDLPGAESRARREVHEAYRQSRVDAEFAAASPYHARVRTAASSGLYAQVLAIESGLGERLDDVPLDQADLRGLMPAAALLLALRQDALAARDFDLAPDNRLRLAAVLARDAGDWPVAIAMTSISGDGPRQRITDLQKDARYLATVYPTAAQLRFLEQPLARAAWPIDGSPELSQSLMYAVARNESRFYPGAISNAGALGLFQFLPTTFADLDRSWGLLQKSGMRSSTEYLLDTDRNVSLWARWMRTVFKLSRRNDIVATVMRHHAGPIRNSVSYWERLGVTGDVEYRVETARFSETRNFLRLVLQDTAIVDAAGFFDERPAR